MSRAKLEAAYARRSLAEQACPHWELETGYPPEPFDLKDECCEELCLAEDAVQKARRALK